MKVSWFLWTFICISIAIPPENTKCQRKLNHKMKKKTALKIVYESYNVYVYLIKVKVVFIVITINAYIILNCVTAK